MASTYTTLLRLVLPTTGELSGTWGNTVNTGMSAMIEAAIAGRVSIAMSDADYTPSALNGTSDEARNMVLRFTGSLTATRNIIIPTQPKLYILDNATNRSLVLKTIAGAGVTVLAGTSAALRCDGTNVVVMATANVDPGGVVGVLPVVNGGTGSTTAPAARTALGSTTVGDALFVTASASAARDVILAQGQNSVETLLTSVSGTNTIVGTLTPAITAYAAGQEFAMTMTGSNTAGATLNINGLGAKTIVKGGNVALTAGDLVTGIAYKVFYDGTNFQLIGGTVSFALPLSKTNGGTGTTTGVFPTGTRMPFAQSAAPAGWTQAVTDTETNRMLRVVNTAGGGIAGSHSPILMNVVPSHTHGMTTGTDSGNHVHYDSGHTHPVGGSWQIVNTTGSFIYNADSSTSATSGLSYANIGGVSAYHTHSGTTDNGSSQTNWAPRYIDMIICSMN